MAIVVIRNAKDIKYRVSAEGFKRLYELVRERKSGRGVDILPTRTFVTDKGENKNSKKSIGIRISSDNPKLPNIRMEVEVATTYKAEEAQGYATHTIVFAWMYAEVEKEDKVPYMVFYNKDNKKVMTVRVWEGDSEEIRCKAGVYYADEKDVPIVVLTNGGCKGCEYSTYEKDAGEWYLTCSKYDGRVKETEYDGLQYPSYCKRRIKKEVD